MDTKTLVVGQIVSMRSGKHTAKGIVVEITERYVGVEPFFENQIKQLICFHHNGIAGSREEGLGQWIYMGGGLLSEDAPWYVPGTCHGNWNLQTGMYEGDPWELVPNTDTNRRNFW